jgi:hypothetical protein
MTNLKYNNFKVGQTIKAFDFKPMANRTDRFVQGKIISIPTDRGYACYEVKSTQSSSFGFYGIDESVFVPMEISFMEYDGRIVEVV